MAFVILRSLLSNHYCPNISCFLAWSLIHDGPIHRRPRHGSPIHRRPRHGRPTEKKKLRTWIDTLDSSTQQGDETHTWLGPRVRQSRRGRIIEWTLNTLPASGLNFFWTLVHAASGTIFGLYKLVQFQSQGQFPPWEFFDKNGRPWYLSQIANMHAYSHRFLDHREFFLKQ